MIFLELMSAYLLLTKNLADDVKPGDHILIDDGLVGLEVVEIKPVAKPVNTKVNARDIVCKVLNDGVIPIKRCERSER